MEKGGSTTAMNLGVSLGPFKKPQNPLLCVDRFVRLKEVHAKVLEKELRQGVEELSKEHKRLTEPIGRYGRIWDVFAPENGPRIRPRKRDYFNIWNTYIFQALIFRGVGSGFVL